MGSKRRNRVGFLVALTFGLSLFVSCSTMHYIKVNHNHTECKQDTILGKEKSETALIPLWKGQGMIQLNKRSGKEY